MPVTESKEDRMTADHPYDPSLIIPDHLACRNAIRSSRIVLIQQPSIIVSRSRSIEGWAFVAAQGVLGVRRRLKRLNQKRRDLGNAWLVEWSDLITRHGALPER